MTVSKRPLLEIEPYPSENEWELFLQDLGVYIKRRFKSGYVKCKAENMGWQRRRSGYKVFTVDTTDHEEKLARIFLNQFTPNCDWCATVYSLNNGKGLYFSLSHHDAQGESYYLTPISQRTYYRLR